MKTWKLLAVVCALVLAVAAVVEGQATRMLTTTGVVYVRSMIGSLPIIRDAIGTTSTDGVRLRNTTAAAAGAQQYSPRLCWEGQGWKTNATAASQSVVLCMELRPVQGAAAPGGVFGLSYSINGAAPTDRLSIDDNGNMVANYITANSNSVLHASYDGLRMGNNNYITWTSGAGYLYTADTRLARDAAATLAVGNADLSNKTTIAAATWGTTLSGEAVSYAADATQSLGAAPLGTLFISIGTENKSCVYNLAGGGNATAEIHDVGTICTVTKDNAATVNIYFDTAAYYIQNKIAGTRTIRAVLIGG